MGYFLLGKSYIKWDCNKANNKFCKRCNLLDLNEKGGKQMDAITSKANREVREALHNKGMKQWELADMLGVSEFTLTRWLRKELTEDKKELLLKAINEA